MNDIIAITIGDIKGIGLRILLDCWKEKKIKNFILFTDIKILNKYIRNKNILQKINFINLENQKINFAQNKLNIYSFKSSSLEENTYKSLTNAYNFCSKKICVGMITLPLRKDLIKERIDKNFIGHTEFFQKLNRKKYSNMILFHKKIIISPLTTHIKIKDIPKIISRNKFLFNQIFNLNNCLKVDFNIKNPKLIISGLNPHSGENGKIGKEELKIIKPTINRLRKIGIDIKGPMSADSMLIKKNLSKFDCFVFIYHDQALVPFKYISQFTGVNYTGNLDIIRTSPDHGTAYDLIHSGEISNKSFINCYKLVKKIYRNRMINDQS